jgi:hypothetical protein
LIGILYRGRAARQGAGRRHRRIAVSTASLLLAAVAFLAPSAGATTGPTPLAHPPRFNVSEQAAAPYLGRFTLAQPSGDQLISGAYIAGHNERGFVEGTIEIYTYDPEGREMVVLGRTYEYHAVGGQMTIDVISPENQVILARLRLHPVGEGRLTGQFRSLLPARKPERMTLAPAPEPDAAPPEQASGPAPEPSAAPAEPEPATSPGSVAATVLAAAHRVFGF